MQEFLPLTLISKRDCFHKASITTEATATNSLKFPRFIISTNKTPNFLNDKETLYSKLNNQFQTFK